ncbi:hypothetical protein FD04_GL001586 [Secundilactobacillus odoratitofui DSM 19909 = JCM 15043]|uniref:Uncharacterized protein n=1 Tax=Secundilactobacillus odoratitofui DSM 19909 = JCM 15043 TaxID=1423776 RepID=A0A0R1LX39_9LACO|nr:glycosyltransferase family 8 protein [Secundilactobacillus odoratitofui]KRK97553.1 hypothetical protein FD04_GL001586 [Secundilactobacillus odoratitofui DSM 19909 = JCM 15043]
MATIDILVTVDEKYVPPLKTMLKSLSQVQKQVNVWLIYRQLSKQTLQQLQRYTERLKFQFRAIQANADIFQGAPITTQYPVETYYRLLSGQILPAELHRVLYLDPDTLIRHSIEGLWQTAIENRCFAAVAHQNDQDSRQRLQLQQPYYNTGVLLINLDCLRQTVQLSEIAAFIKSHPNLPLVDQDVLNGLYGQSVVQLNDRLWNFDVPSYEDYLKDGVSRDWIEANTKILHYQRQPKPWEDSYDGPLANIYQRVMRA